MTSTITVPRRTRHAILGALALLAGGLTQAATSYVETDLVSDKPGRASQFDPNLVNPWGIATSATSPFWVANNATGTSTLYNTAGVPQSLVVTIPPPANPTGIVFNSTAGFVLANGAPARFIFATEGGTLAGWNGPSGTLASTVFTSTTNAVYKGLAIGSTGGESFLYAANFAGGTIDAFDSAFTPVTLTGNFVDPGLPAGFAPFNVQNLGGTLYVAYAQKQAAGDDEVAGPGLGYVDAFSTNGNFIRRIAGGGTLNAPWGLALAPANFGEFSNDLLVGNFGDGRINVFDPTADTFLGQLSDGSNPISIDGLWALQVGNGGNGGEVSKVYFTAGIEDESHGLFGSLSVPEPGTLALLGIALSGLPLRRRQR